MTPPLYTARKTAWLVLNQCDTDRQDAGDLLNQYLPNTDRPAQATDIVFGVVRHRLALDSVIKKCGSVEPARVKPGLWNLLRIGTYELVYAPKTAEYAIINEVCDLARQKGSARTVGFINAVLRAVQKNILSRQAPIARTDAQTLLPQDDQTGCAFTTNILPSPAKDPVNYYSLAFSLPTWLISRWLQEYGDDKTRQICAASNRHPSIIAQPNTLCTTAEKLAALLTEAGVECELNPKKTMLCIRHTGQITKIQAFLDGYFMIQDPTAAEAMALLKPQPGWNIADLCAAPGGKSIALAMLMQDTGTILASDNDIDRLQKVRQNIDRMRLNAVEVVKPKDIDHKIHKLKKLDAIVLDVPCSNTGVLARRVEARWRLQKSTLDALLNTQQQLLIKAAELCRSKTHIVYSTCSIEPEENQQQIQHFLSQYPAIALVREKLTLPALKTQHLFDHDGGYVAVLRQK
jgi:16S rRNA (cytosine967-C5)-methyltransferase